jgi:SNF2 family DNA or RNA helicase
LQEIIDTANGQTVLVFYAFQHDRDRIMQRMKALKPQQLESRDDIRRWNEGKIDLLLCHPASAGHGLNLQAGGNIIVWYGLTWSLELYQQANARLDRQGQTKPVIVHHLVSVGTMDEDVMKALELKAEGQNALMNAVKARIAKYLNQTKTQRA